MIFSAFFLSIPNIPMRDTYHSEISNTEKHLLPLLFNHCRLLFSDYHLPSHDHHHHMRVWSFARELICELSYLEVYLNRNEISLLMLSVFFHDTGLTRTLDENHGCQSRKMCEKFLEENYDIFSYDTTEALNAIELHDKKRNTH